MKRDPLRKVSSFKWYPSLDIHPLTSIRIWSTFNSPSRRNSKSTTGIIYPPVLDLWPFTFILVSSLFIVTILSGPICEKLLVMNVWIAFTLVMLLTLFQLFSISYSTKQKNYVTQMPQIHGMYNIFLVIQPPQNHDFWHQNSQLENIVHNIFIKQHHFRCCNQDQGPRIPFVVIRYC